MRIYPTTCVISFVEDLKLHYNNLSDWIRGLYTVYREGTLHTLTSVSLQNTKTLLALYSESKFTMSFLRANVHSQEMGCKKPYLLYYDALPYLSKRMADFGLFASLITPAIWIQRISVFHFKDASLPTPALLRCSLLT